MPILYGFSDDEIKEFPAVILRVRLQANSDITEKPIQDGFTVTDGVTVKPEQWTVTLQLSPIRVRGEALGVRDAIDLLRRIQRSRTVCTISGRPQDISPIEEMILISWSGERSVEQGEGCEVECEFKQLTVATSNTSAPVPRTPRQRPMIHRGSQSTNPEPRRSLAAALFEDMTGMGLMHSTTPRR